MTTLVAVRKAGHIAIAADSLTTFGDLRLSAAFDKSYEKILHYKGSYIGLCGSAAHQLVFESILKDAKDMDFSGKTAIFESLRKQADPTKLEEKAKVIAERQAAQNEKAQQRLGELVCLERRA